jgi:short-subunit dehydrogenase
MKKTNLIALSGLAYMGAKFGGDFRRRNYFKGKVALITGGSKGLGFVLAQHLLNKNANVAICARSLEELEDARSLLEKNGHAVHTIICDVSDKNQVKAMIENVIDHYGQLDFIFNNAGIITVGSMETFKEEDYRASMDVMYWGIVNTTLSALPHMKKRRTGHIINITSVGGKVSIPHLLAYNSAKFAAVGFSEGIAAELRKDNIHVTTIIPGLMRTGSYVNALFPENKKDEFKIFSFMSSTPLLTLDADKAARRILKATEKKRIQKILGFQARAAIELHHFFPNFTVRMFGLLNRILPEEETPKKFEKGLHLTRKYKDAEVPGVREIGQRAQDEHQPSSET